MKARRIEHSANSLFLRLVPATVGSLYHALIAVDITLNFTSMNW